MLLSSPGFVRAAVLVWSVWAFIGPEDRVVAASPGDVGFAGSVRGRVFFVRSVFRTDGSPKTFSEVK